MSNASDSPPVKQNPHAQKQSANLASVMPLQMREKIERTNSLLPKEAQNALPVLSPEDIFVLYSVLQELANELRRMTHEETNHAQGN